MPPGVLFAVYAVSYTHLDVYKRQLLDMDYFLNEDDLFADEAGVEGFYIF